MLDRKHKRIPEPLRASSPSASHLAHEFRTPLTVVKELVALVHDELAGPLNGRQREYLAMAADRVDDLAGIVDGTLDQGKMEAGELGVWRRRSTLQKIVAGVRGTLLRKAAVKKVRLEVSLAENLPEVYCDPEMIGRVIVKLIACAVTSSMEAGRVTLRAQWDAETADVLLRVKAVGRTDQPHNTAEGPFPGFGSILPMLRDLARLNQGQIHGESRPQSGPAFSLTIPRWHPRELADRFLGDFRNRPRAGAFAVLAVAELKPAPSPGLFDLADGFLQRIFRVTDFVLPISSDRWLVVAICPKRDVDAVLDRVQNAWIEAAGNSPGESLPEITFSTRGVWDLETGTDELADALHSELRSAEKKAEVRRVLLVEDDRELLRGLELRLQAAGYEVVVATDGHAAIDSAIKHRPHAILMDNYMPGMDGLQAMGRLAELPDTKDIPIIMISASARDQQKALRQGARFFLQKPCSAKTIVAALDNVIKDPFPAAAE